MSGMLRGRLATSRGGRTGRGRGRKNESTTTSLRYFGQEKHKIKPREIDLILDKDGNLATTKIKMGYRTYDKLLKEKVAAEAELKALEHGSHPQLKKLQKTLEEKLSCIQRWSSLKEQNFENANDEKLSQIQSNFKKDRIGLQNRLIQELKQELNRLKKSQSAVTNPAKKELYDEEQKKSETTLQQHKSIVFQSANDDSYDSLASIFGEEGNREVTESQKEEGLKFTLEEIMEGMAEVTALKSKMKT